MLGWDFPDGNGLREQFDDFGLYPLTSLTTLTLPEKQLLLDKKSVFCREICDNPNLLSISQITAQRKKAIINKAVTLWKGIHR